MQIISDEPNSTVLGPLLCLVALSDMISVVQRAAITSYIDDRKVSQVIQKAEDAVHLQLERDCRRKMACIGLTLSL